MHHRHRSDVALKLAPDLSLYFESSPRDVGLIQCRALALAWIEYIFFGRENVDSLRDVSTGAFQLQVSSPHGLAHQSVAGIPR